MSAGFSPRTPTDYDVTDLKARLDHETRYRRYLLLSIIVFLLGFTGFLLWFALPSTAGTHPELPRVTVAVIFVVGAGVITYQCAMGITTTRLGASRVRVDSAGLALFWPNGTTVHRRWDRTEDKFQLLEFSPELTQRSVSQVQFCIRVGKVVTALSATAFQDIFGEANNRRLVTKVTKGDRWTIRHVLSATVYHVEGHPSASDPTTG